MISSREHFSPRPKAHSTKINLRLRQHLRCSSCTSSNSSYDEHAATEAPARLQQEHGLGQVLPPLPVVRLGRAHLVHVELPLFGRVAGHSPALPGDQRGEKGGRGRAGLLIPRGDAAPQPRSWQ